MLGLLEKEYATTASEANRQRLETFRAPVTCAACGGVRLRPEARSVRIGGKAIHANNTDRGIAPRQDIAKARLAKGWNDLVLKVINHGGGWAAACRIRKPGGAAIDGLKYEAK